MRALGLVYAQLRSSALLSLQYRADFVIDALLELMAAASAIVPLVVVYADRDAVAGVTMTDALLVVGTFTMLTGVVEGAINPSVVSVIEHVRSGTLDFVLLKPADAQLLVSTSRFLPWRFVNILAGVAIIVITLGRANQHPSPTDILLAALLFVCGIVVLYSLVMLAVTLAFFAVRADNLAYVITSVVDAGRWPIRVFRGAARFIFTFVFPLAVMTSFPADALRGAFAWRAGPVSLGLAIGFFVGSRALFRWALRRYASASS